MEISITNTMVYGNNISYWLSNGTRQVITVDGLNREVSPYEATEIYNKTTGHNYSLELNDYYYTTYERSDVTSGIVELSELKEMMNNTEKSNQITYVIQKMNNECLRRVSKDIGKDVIGSEELKDLISLLAVTLGSNNGLGIAAPQVGVNVNLFLMNVPSEVAEKYENCVEMNSMVFINPKFNITDLSLVSALESCLSIPGYAGLVYRPKSIKITSEGNEDLELSGFNARIFMHEFDHLKGIVYIDRAKDLKESYRYKEEIEELRYLKRRAQLNNYGLKL